MPTKIGRPPATQQTKDFWLARIASVLSHREEGLTVKQAIAAYNQSRPEGEPPLSEPTYHRHVAEARAGFPEGGLPAYRAGNGKSWGLSRPKDPIYPLLPTAPPPIDATTTKLCAGSCGRDLDHSEFVIINPHRGTRSSTCQNCYAEYHEDLYRDVLSTDTRGQTRRDRHRALLSQIKARHGCCVCQQDDPLLLQFHHRDPTLKDATVSKMAGTSPWPEITDEVLKCLVLCSYCHTKHHRGVLSVLPNLPLINLTPDEISPPWPGKYKGGSPPFHLANGPQTTGRVGRPPATDAEQQFWHDRLLAVRYLRDQGLSIITAIYFYNERRSEGEPPLAESTYHRHVALLNAGWPAEPLESPALPI